MNSQTIDIPTLLPWSEPKEVNTRLGRKLLRKAAPTPAFSAVWKTGKDALKAAGVSWSKDERTGKWQVCWWSPLDAAKVQAEEKAVEASRAVAADVDLPVPDGLAYLPFQRAGIATMASRSRNLLGDEMGLGKTVQSIALISLDPTVKKVLVMCPCGLKVNWSREVAKWSTRPLRVGIQEAGQPWIGEVADVVVMNYDIAHRYEAQISSTKWDLFVADEAHYLKNPRAKRTAVVLGRKERRDRKTGDVVPGYAGVQARKVVLATGTPLTNRPMELFPLLHYLDPVRWPNGFKFGLRYAAGHQTRFGWDFTGSSNLDELQRDLRAHVMVRRTKKEVLPDLPPKRRQIIELSADGLEDMIAEENAAAERAEANIVEMRARLEVAALAEDEAAYASIAAKLHAAQQVAFESMSKVRQQTAMAKLPMCIEHIRSVMDQNGKVVVFAHHREAVEQLQAAFADENAVKLYGGMSAAEKDAAIQAFNNDPACRVFVGALLAAGVGFSLKASTEIFCELDWVPGNVTQCEDRCYGVGRGIEGEPLLVQHLVLEGSLDARMVKFIVKKQDVIDRALDKGVLKLDAVQPVLSVTVGSVLDDTLQAAAPRQNGTATAAEAPTGVKVAEAVPAASEELRAHVHAGLKALAGCDTDFASEINGVGFNKFDGVFGHCLAERGFLTDKMVWAGAKLVNKYRNQLGEGYTDTLFRLTGRQPKENND